MMTKADTGPLARARIQSNIDLHVLMLGQSEYVDTVASVVASALERDGKVVIFGNGGSAADAQHIAAELVSSQYDRSRRSLPAIALHANGSALTAIANDYGYEEVFARQVEAFCRPGDVVIGISTSGNSENVVRGVRAAKVAGAVTIGLTGRSGGRVAREVDYCVAVPSNDTPRIQEVHILVGHIICEYVEQRLYTDA